MKMLFILQIMITASVLAFMMASAGYIFIGGSILLAVTKASFVAFTVSAVVNMGKLLLNEHRQAKY